MTLAFHFPDPALLAAYVLMLATSALLAVGGNAFTGGTR